MAGRGARTAIAIAAVVLLSGCWTQFRGDAAHTGAQDWEFSLGASDAANLDRSWTGPGVTGSPKAPVVVDGIAYYSGRNSGALRAADAAGGCVATRTCAERWRATLPADITMTPAVGGGRIFVAARAKLYAFSTDGATNCAGTPLTCTPLWTAMTGSEITAAPTLADGVVYTISASGKLSAFDAAGATNCTGTPLTCTALWTANPAAYHSPAVANGAVFVTIGDGSLAAYDAGGIVNCTGTLKTCKPLWTAALGGRPGAGAAIRNGTVFVPGGSANILAFDASGTANCSGASKVCTPLWTGISSDVNVELAVASDRVYASNADSTVVVFDAAGIAGCSGTPATCEPLWAAPTNEPNYALVIANGMLYAQSVGTLYMFDAGGVRNCGGDPTECRPLGTVYSGGSDIAVANGAVYTNSSPVSALQPCINPVAAVGWAPCDLWNAYRLPGRRLSVVDMTVGITVAFHNPNAEADMTTYRNTFGLPGCPKSNGCFRQVNQDGVAGNYPPTEAGWAIETSLDLQMVSAICPYCKIVLVEAQPTRDGLPKAVDTAVALGADVVSNSWGRIEDDTLADLDVHFDHPGVPIVVASGDDGYAAGPQYPAVLPTVTSVGGTTLSRAPSTGRGWAETVWHDGFNTAISGGACSLYREKPAWQTDTGCAQRTSNDVAAVAQDLAIYDSLVVGGWLSVGGTSAASPIIGATYAFAQGTTGAQNMYTNASAFFDVTEGNTGECGGSYLCTAGVGYDAPTGVGTPCGIGAFGPARKSPPGCGGPASVPTAALRAQGTAEDSPDLVPACRTVIPGGWRCLAYVER